METLQQDHTPQTCYATDKPFKSEAILHSASVEHHWISGSTKNAWCWLKDGSSCMQQDSCNTFIFATFCPECWTILAFGVAKMPKLSKLLPGPEWSWSCYTSEAISISITFSLDRSLCEKVSVRRYLWEGICFNVVWQHFLARNTFRKNILWKPQIAWELCAFKMFIGTFATAMLVGKYLQNFGQAHCQHESSTYLLKHGANKTQNWRIKRLENQPPHSFFLTNIPKQILGKKSQATESTLLGKTATERNMVIERFWTKKWKKLFPSFKFKHIQ